MPPWIIAGVQMDVRLGDKPANLAAIRGHLQTAAGRGAKLVIFPECVLTGYGFASKADAWPFAEPVPGPSTQALVEMCREFQLFAVIGSMEAEAATGHLFNVALLVGPDGLIANYRKIHLPFLGVDRFTTPGDRPFAVHDLGGLRVGLAICYDSSFPEASRCLMLEGADLIILPTNWPAGALRTAQVVPTARALENHVYFAAINRVGTESGVRYIGHSSIVNPWGDNLAVAESDEPQILFATLDPDLPRQKHIVRIPGEYELHRTRDRRPEMYGPITRPLRPV